jgi:phage terminase large subunit
MADQAQTRQRPRIQEAIPKAVRDVFFDEREQWIPSPWKCLHGGRGGLKSWTFARLCVLLAAKRKVRILCAREVQNSIADSVHAVISEQIDLFHLDRYFDIQDNWIGSYTGSEFIFRGLKTHPKKIKSLEGINIAWVEEAENISKESWRILTPTVYRNPGAEIWVGFNPDQRQHPASQMFIEQPVPGLRVRKTTWRDNPHLPEQMLADKDYLARVDPDAYQHVWEGGYREASDAQIFKGKYVIEAFTPDPKVWSGPHQGADWGYVDPTVFMRCWIHERKLFIEYEAYKVGADLHQLDQLYSTIPEFAKYATRGDNARPETISYLQQHGLPRIVPCEKWDGSVEDGIAHIRSYEQVVIHPRCVQTAIEAKLYSYKVDKITSEVLPEIVDKHNHCWDAMRYALQKAIRKANTGFLEYAKQAKADMDARRAQESKPS